MSYDSLNRAVIGITNAGVLPTPILYCLPSSSLSPSPSPICLYNLLLLWAVGVVGTSQLPRLASPPALHTLLPSRDRQVSLLHHWKPPSLLWYLWIGLPLSIKVSQQTSLQRGDKVHLNKGKCGSKSYLISVYLCLLEHFTVLICVYVFIFLSVWYIDRKFKFEL